MQSCPTFVISLERDLQRRTHMDRELLSVGITAEFVSAVDGLALSAADRSRYDAVRALQVYGCAMLDTEIGCYLSHYQLYGRIVRENIPAALILEDDLEISPALPRIVAELLADPDPQWLIVRMESMRTSVLHPRTPNERGNLVRTLSDGELRQISTHVLGLGGYLIRQEGARRMLSYGRRIFMPIDHTMDRFWENDIVPYVVRPFPVCQRPDFASRIGPRLSDRHRDQPAVVRTRRRWQRLLDGLRKRLFIISLARQQRRLAGSSAPRNPRRDAEAI